MLKTLFVPPHEFPKPWWPELFAVWLIVYNKPNLRKVYQNVEESVPERSQPPPKQDWSHEKVCPQPTANTDNFTMHLLLILLLQPMATSLSTMGELAHPNTDYIFHPQKLLSADTTPKAVEYLSKPRWGHHCQFGFPHSCGSWPSTTKWKGSTPLSNPAAHQKNMGIAGHVDVFLEPDKSKEKSGGSLH